MRCPRKNCLLLFEPTYLKPFEAKLFLYFGRYITVFVTLRWEILNRVKKKVCDRVSVLSALFIYAIIHGVD
jgi:hypothetical protein